MSQGGSQKIENLAEKASKAQVSGHRTGLDEWWTESGGLLGPLSGRNLQLDHLFIHFWCCSLSPGSQACRLGAILLTPPSPPPFPYFLKNSLTVSSTCITRFSHLHLHSSISRPLPLRDFLNVSPKVNDFIMNSQPSLQHSKLQGFPSLHLALQTVVWSFQRWSHPIAAQASHTWLEASFSCPYAFHPAPGGLSHTEQIPEEPSWVCSAPFCVV